MQKREFLSLSDLSLVGNETHLREGPTYLDLGSEHHMRLKSAYGFQSGGTITSTNLPARSFILSMHGYQALSLNQILC